MQNILFQLGFGDEKFLPFLKPILIGKCNLHLNNTQPTAVLEVVMRAREKGCKFVATTSPKLLSLLLGKSGTLDDYAGSIIEKYGVEFLILNPVEHLITVPYGRFLYERYFRKFLHIEEWLSIPNFTWELFQPARYAEILASFAKASFISCDIETRKDDERRITCCGFTALYIDRESRTFTTRTVVVPATDLYHIAVIRAICSLRVPKTFQNGKYDNAYLLRYNITVVNWAFDTAHLFHAWYSELPKRLDFITSFMLRKWQYWKDESDTQDLMEYYQYNAKDCFTTAMSWLALMLEVPDWAWRNYLQEFPLVFPCLLAEMTGIKTDTDRMLAEETRFNVSLELQLKSLQIMAGCKFFNPSSPPQVMKLFTMLGCQDIKDTKPASRDKVASRHPLNKRLMTAIMKYRQDRKIATSYLRDYNPKTKKFRIWKGRMFYTLNPHGTDTGRLASEKSAFWCGTNMTNQPRGRTDIEVRSIYVADNGFHFGECDYEQAEARDTAYLSGDTNLIKAVEDVTKDFHSKNASAFFGVEYEKICISTHDAATDTWEHMRIDIPLIDVSKRTNHGANYNMGGGVMLDTMGYEKVIRAKRLLKLPAKFTLLDTTKFLLTTYEKTYPVVKGDWYKKVTSDVMGSHFLIGPTGWSRYCFGNPLRSKQDLNAYVAHPPQSLNAMTLNKAWLRVFYEVALKNVGNFKLLVQIHDSILFQYRIGHEHLAFAVKKLMLIDTPVKDTYGIERILRVPVALKGGATRWSDIKSLKE